MAVGHPSKGRYDSHTPPFVFFSGRACGQTCRGFFIHQVFLSPTKRFNINAYRGCSQCKPKTGGGTVGVFRMETKLFA
jgi:hypothetical protein